MPNSGVLLAGIDLGGTKCAVSVGRPVPDGTTIEILAKRRFPTPDSPAEAMTAVIDGLASLFRDFGHARAIGVSCGGPLDSKRGLILSPPNLPNWDKIDVLTPLRDQFGIPAALQNDANACALAEWRWGAGRGYQNVIFLTFGTGMGAGLILDGRLYSGTNDMAGEVGHIRLERFGPPGYGKVGSFEGFCSGGGIARYARTVAEARLQSGYAPQFCPTLDALDEITAEKVALAAAGGDPTAQAIFETVSEQLGRGLSILIDVLNPERIVIGSIYTRQRDLLEGPMLRVLRQEALSLSLSVCEIVPAALGEQVGDYASLSVALLALV